MSGIWIGSGVVRQAGFAAAIVLGATVAEARPLRGPAARAERRVARAQAVLERDRARAPVRASEPKPAAAPQPAATKPTATKPTATKPEVARATYEAPVSKPEPAADTPAAAPEPAADGTVSVLVRPEARAARPQASQDVAGEPLRFPEPSTP